MRQKRRRAERRTRRAALPLAVAALTSVVVLGTTAAADGTGGPGSTDPSGSSGSSNSSGSASRATVSSDHPKWAIPAADLGSLDAATPLTARVGLAGRDPAGLAAFAAAVSTPGSGSYRHFLTPAQVQARYGPTARQVATVRKWLASAGLTVTDQNSHWIDVAGPAAAMQKAFGTRIDAFTVTGGGTRHAVSGTVSVPRDVAAAVSSVAGLSQVTRGAHEGATGAVATERGSVGAGSDKGAGTGPARNTGRIPSAVKAAAVTPGSADGRTAPTARSAPTCSPEWGAIKATGFPAGYTAPTPYDICGYLPGQLRTAYGVTAAGMTGKGVTVAVVDAYGSPTMPADANQFSTAHGDRPFASGQYRESVDPSAWTHLSDGLCQAPADWAGEESLDVEMVHGLAPYASVRYVGATSCTDQDLTAAFAKIVDERSADVVSASFGETMHETTGDIDPAVVTQENAVFVAGAAEGIGFDVSSGDCGNDAAGLRGPNCDPLSARVQTEWPASSVWATAVGGTALATTPDGHYRWETNMGDRRSVLSPDGKSWVPFPGFFYFGGGGGTSEDFAQPAFQHGVVPEALAHTLGSGKYSPTPMRTVPDVAMNGDLLTAVTVGQTDPATGRYGEIQVGGTSVSSPEFTGLQADAMQAAHTRFGFADPMLYGRAGSGQFTDVVDHPAGSPAVISTVLDLGLNTDGTRKVRLYELGQDNGLSATPGYDLATGIGSPRAGYIRSFK